MRCLLRGRPEDHLRPPWLTRFGAFRIYRVRAASVFCLFARFAGARGFIVQACFTAHRRVWLGVECCRGSKSAKWSGILRKSACLLPLGTRQVS